jgi:hypothetical protein
LVDGTTNYVYNYLLDRPYPEWDMAATRVAKVGEL